VEAAAAQPAGFIPLYDTVVTVRSGGVNVRAQPNVNSERLSTLSVGERRQVNGLVWRDYSWLQIYWDRTDQAADVAYIAGEFTDFPRSAAYNQVVNAWYESPAMLAFRRTLAKAMMRAQNYAPELIERVNRMKGESLRALEEFLTQKTMLPLVAQFQGMQTHLGLPDPFDYLPVHTSPPANFTDMEFNGFGPNSFSYQYWPIYYSRTRGMHNGVDYIVPEGSPLIAVTDGVIIEFRFLANSAERTLSIRAYMPDTYRNPDGSRKLSNVIIAYGHLTGDPTSQLVRIGDTVRAGQIIGTSGWPVYTREDGSVGIQYNNAHLHLETHLVNHGDRSYGSRFPFNPLLFFSSRLAAWQARRVDRPPYPTTGHPYGKLGLFTIGAFSYEPQTPRVWDYTPTPGALWPPGVYNLRAMINYVKTFRSYL
jgi:murein DD-endopeptidase MepM/ murein hydrolase activator NlpD